MNNIQRCGLLLLTCLTGFSPSHAGGQVVTKDIGNFANGQWIPSMWNAASGRVTGGKETETVVLFSGRGFEHFALEPKQPLLIPGKCRKVFLRFKMNEGYGVSVKFNDGWGRGEADGKKYDWGLPSKMPDQWQELVFNVPTNWIMPLQLTGFSTHNWGNENKKTDFHFTLGGLKVETDISDVDPGSGKLLSWTTEPNPKTPKDALKECPAVPLLQTHINATELSNVFAGEEPQVHVVVNNWKAGTATGTLAYKILDNSGKVISTGDKSIAAESFCDVPLGLPVEKFGRYQLNATLNLEGGTEIKESLVFAKIPAPRQLTAQEKEDSPYGLNIHSGKLSGDLISYLPPFIKAGLYWYRDYAWAYGWLERARGDDGKFGGWPYYNKVGKHAKELGIILMPCLQDSIRVPKEVDGKVLVNTPDRNWVSGLVLAMNAFPDLKYWELDNEYNLRDNQKKLEDKVGWKNYKLYHQRFADAADALSAGEIVAVEEGRAGCHPEKIEDCVRSGSFDKIKVVNSHSYCGSEPPETSGENMNTGGGGDSGSVTARTFYDNLRDAKKAGCADGKVRQHWLTEFAWDTLAGHVVTPYQQAAYLPRSWMLALATGTEKCFWFGDADSAHPALFFDGCGLMGPGPRNEPKLSLCSLAGLTHILPSPTYIGTLDAGEGSCGYLFSQYGKLVASLWMIATDDGLNVEVKAETVYDYLGNPLPAGKQKLNNTPLYAVGVDKDSHWYAQTAYELASRHILAGAIGDTVEATVEVRNNRENPLTCELSMSLPGGWENKAGLKTLTVKPGETNLVVLPFSIPMNVAMGVKPITIAISENGKPLKTMPFTLQVRDPLALSISPLGNTPCVKEVQMTIANLSASPRTGSVTLQLPSTWKAVPLSMAVTDLLPGQKRALDFKIDWSAGVKEGDTASATFATTGNAQITKPLIAGMTTIHRFKGRMNPDGDLSDWSEKNRLPDWMIGSTMGKSGAQFWMGWAPEGLYVAVKVEDSILDTLDPRSFWGAECLELFIATTDAKRHEAYEPGDHQFWVVPQVAKGTAYVGQWKRNNEIPSIVYDLQGVTSAARASGSGYVMEFMIPASALQKFDPKAGGHIGLNLNLNIKGKGYDREAFWPEAKNNTIINQPKAWGSAELAE